MPDIRLYGQNEGKSILLSGTLSADGKSFSAGGLVLPNSSSFNLSEPVVIPLGFLKKLANDYQFVTAANGFAFTARFVLSAGAVFQFFALQFDASASIEAEVSITVPPLGAPPSPETPFAAITVCGNIAINAVPLFASESCCFEVAIDSIPVDLSLASIPNLRLRFPDLGFTVPHLSLPWSDLQIPLPPYKLAAVAISLEPLPITVSVKSIDVQIAMDAAKTKTSIVFRNLRIEGTIGAIEGDLQVVLQGATVLAKECSFNLYQPDFQHLIALAISDWQLAPGCFGLSWTEPALNRWLGFLIPDIAAIPSLASSDVALRVIWDGGLREVRLDFAQNQAPISIPLPGFEIDLPPIEFLSLIGYPDPADGSPRVLLAASIEGGKTLTAHSTFTWIRDSDSNRELHKSDDAPAKEFIRFSATTKGTLSNAEAPFPDVKLGYTDDVTDPEPEPDPDADLGPATALSLVLFDLPLKSGKPQFFRQLNTPLDYLLPTDPLPYSFEPSDPSSDSIRLDKDWDHLSLIINGYDVMHPEKEIAYKLPFLSGPNQGISLKFDHLVPPQKYPDPYFAVHLNAVVQVGTLTLNTQLQLDFYYEQFAFKVSDGAGITFQFAEQPGRSFLGLDWRFLGPGGKLSGFDLFRLVIVGSNYQLRQEPGTTIEADYTAATKAGSAITFLIQDFDIGPRGIDLSATVSDRPAKLAGIDTEFSFREGSFQIKEDRLTGFSLTGSGPLPPALVGSATAQISLQFEQGSDGNLALVSGGAKLEGKNLLKCQGTRFNFEVDALGLKFVKDGGSYHLYFTVTGTATYNPLASDDPSGPLAWLPKIEMRMMECPLTGDASVIARHVDFLIELPKKVDFDFLGCFQFELRGIGFVPQAPMFDSNASAMRLSGQIKFSDNGGDVLDIRIDLHDLYIGLPSPGNLLPRLYLKELGVKIKSGDAFEIDGYVDFLNDDDVNGFSGSGSVLIQGLPKIAAAFSFVRVRGDNAGNWLRAWFLYLEIREISIEIPIIEVFIREIGFGFGYRYTLASIKESDDISDPRVLIQKLKELALSQGDLANPNQWRVDAGGSNDPRWSVVFRAMISQSSASAGVLDWHPQAEQMLSCLFLMDVVVALRSDLTFLMTSRAWLSTNYWEYDNDSPSGLRNAPLLEGFVLLSPRQKRFLAHLNSNPNAKFGKASSLGFLQDVLAQCYFTATLLIEPGLMQCELGWPNQLRWGANIGPLNAEFRGGTLVRLSKTEFVIGNSFEARGSLQLQAGIDLGFIGAQLTALAHVAYGARYIGVIAFEKPFENSAYYGVAGVDIQVTVAIAFWIHIDLGWFGSITINFGFSFAIALTAAVQVGITLRSGFPAGVRGTATVQLNVMGHGLHFNICVGINDTAVSIAQSMTQRFLNVGLEASDVQPIPGETPAPAALAAKAVPAPMKLDVADHAQVAELVLQASPLLGDVQEAAHPAGKPLVVPADVITPPVAEPVFLTPDYSIFYISKDTPSNHSGTELFVLVPAATRKGNKLGFLPVPPDDGITPDYDFSWTLPDGTSGLTRYNPKSSTAHTWEVQPVQSAGKPLQWQWQANWDAVIGTGQNRDSADPDHPAPKVTPRTFLRYAYLVQYPPKPAQVAVVPAGDTPSFGNVMPYDDPLWLPTAPDPIEDARVYNPSDSSYEASVRAASDQVLSGKFKFDPNSPYDSKVEAAFDLRTSIYAPGGTTGRQENQSATEPMTIPDYQIEEQAVQARSSVIQSFVSDLQVFAADPEGFFDPTKGQITKSVAFQMGLVFSATGPLPPWLKCLNSETAGTLNQRSKTTDKDVDMKQSGSVSVFNNAATRFNENIPHFTRVTSFADASTIWITWDLEWDWTTLGGQSKQPGVNQDDPNHHLQYYIVRRRRLDGADRGIEFNVKQVDVLHRGTDPKGNETINRLRSRFQINDHFSEDTAQDLADLPYNGKTYLYTITPVDLAGNLSPKPLTVVATRRSNEPPQLPSNIQLTVKYTLPSTMPSPSNAPLVQTPSSVNLTWVEPPANPSAPTVYPDHRGTRLIFRRETALPIGSYGLDAAAQGARADGLPTTNARPLGSDLTVPVDLPATPQQANVPLQALQAAGILSSGRWQPGSWRIFVQRVSRSGVYSALAPVEVILEFGNAGTKATEVRQPGNLEFIAQPVAFSFLPPEDERVDVGQTFVPFPDTDVKLCIFHPDAPPTINFQPHPNASRAIQFLWNQASTRPNSYPPDLHSGYQVFEYDLDAHTAAPIDAAPAPAPPPSDAQVDGIRSDFLNRLRLIQQVELLSPYDAELTPSNTLSPAKWEAWYPATAHQRGIATACGLKVPYGPWFSWRESFPVWPPAEFSLNAPQGETISSSVLHPLVNSSGQRTWPRHPFLQQLINDLSAPKDKDDNPIYVVDLAPLPPSKPSTLNDFIAENTLQTDPYGWRILQLCGLCICFCIRINKTGVALAGAETIEMIGAQLKKYGDLGSLQQHLQIEYLVQAGRSIRVAEDILKPVDLLGIVQVSLRPVVRQVLRYGVLVLRGDPASVALDLKLNGNKNCTILTSLSPDRQEIPFEADGKLIVTIPKSGTLQIVVRTEDPIHLGVVGPNNAALTFTEVQLNDLDQLCTFEGTPSSAVQISITVPEGASCTILDPTTLARLADLSETGDVTIPVAPSGTGQFLLRTQSFGSYKISGADAKNLVQGKTQPASLASYFTVDVNMWVKLYGSASLVSQWNLLWTYLQSTNSTDPSLPHIEAPDIVSAKAATNLPHIEAPDIVNAKAATNLEPILTWMQRFLDLGMPEGSGPWIATAYPRLVSPVAVVPDVAGRVEYFHLVTDPWAHTFRYYIQPRGRYDKLWQSVAQSPALFPSAKPPAIPRPVDPRLLLGDGITPEPGGLDVVLDRIKEVAAPLILSSCRIDLFSDVASPARPGALWEVILAKHPEQTLIERNQTLMRQLAYRQIAVTLLRRFAFSPEFKDFQKAAGPIQIAGVIADRAKSLLPGAYPPPDTLDLTQEENIRAIDLPLRVGDFSRGVVVYQWSGLPYYYEHRVIAVAQTTQEVSEPVETLQRDFEYLSPSPAAEIDGQAGTQGTPRQRLIRIELASYWDCLPLSAQLQWPIEDPTQDAGAARKYASLPEVHAVYQLFYKSVGGTTETIAEFSFDTDYVVKQISTVFKAIKVGVVQLSRPPLKQDRFFLASQLQQVISINLIRPPKLPEINGDFSRSNLNSILYPSIPEFAAIATWPGVNASTRSITEFLTRWYAVRSISADADLTSEPELASKISFVRSDSLVLVWSGSTSDNLLKSLEKLATSTPDDLKPALQQMDTELRSGAAFSIQTAPLPFTAHLPGELSKPGSLQVQVDRLIWRGPLLPGQSAALDSLQQQFRPNSSGVDVMKRLRAALETAGPFPVRPQIFAVPVGGLGDLKQLMSNPLTGLQTENIAPSSFRLTWTGVDNLGEDLDVLTTRLATVFPDTADTRRVALAAIFSEIAQYRIEVPLVAIPPELSQSLFCRYWLIQCSQQLTDADQAALKKLYPQAPDADSLSRLQNDLMDMQSVDHVFTDWISEEAISSRADFGPIASRWNDRYEFAPPNSCVLTIPQPITDDQMKSLLAIDADLSFRDALRRLASGSPTAEATVGLEQITEISASVLLQVDLRKLIWKGSASPSQLTTLKRWQTLSSFTQTFKALLDAIEGWTFALAAEVDPHNLPVLLQARLDHGNWIGLQLSPEESLALTQATQDTTLPQAATDSLKGLVTALNSSTVTVDVEAAWKPRPTADKLPDNLRNSLLIGCGLLRYYGLMTADEVRDWLTTTSLSVPNQNAITSLFNKSMFAGLLGGSLQIGARLGSAKANSSLLTASLITGGPHA